MEKIIPLSLIIGHISAVLFHGLIALGLACLFTSCRTQSNVAEANEQGILIVGNSNEPKGLDPHLVSGVHESNI
ncbi:hypothetical protein N9999_02370, partial [bacterium]|nr:hypothetical protein [bacterium]